MEKEKTSNDAAGSPVNQPAASDQSALGKASPVSSGDSRDGSASAFSRLLPFERAVTITGTRASVVPLPPERGALVRYTVAMGVTLAALLLTLALAPYLQRVMLILFWPAVLFSAWFGGRGAAVLSSVASIVSADLFLFPPLHRLNLANPTEAGPLLLFLLASLLVSTLTESLRVERRRAALAAAENAGLAAQLESQAMELEHQLEESQAMSEELEQSSLDLADRTAVAESAEQFTRGIVESIADPFVVHDANWRFRYVNAPATEVFRTSTHPNARDIVGRALWEEYPELAGTVFEREMRGAMEERRPRSFEAFYPARGTWLAISCFPLPDGGVATQWRDITSRKRAEEAERYLARASDLLASSLDYEVTLTQLAHLVVPELGDWCAIQVVGDDGTSRQLAVAHVDPAKAQWAVELGGRYPADPNAATGVPKVLRTGKPELYPEISEEMLAAGAVDEEHLRLTRQLGLRSAIIVPLIAHDRTLGALTLVSAESGRRYTNGDLLLLMELARRAALAVDNARLHRAALAARNEAAAAEEQLTRVLAQAPVAIALLRGPDHIFRIANERYMEMLGRRDLIGRPFREAFADLAGQNGADYLDEVFRSGVARVNQERHVILPRGPGGAMEDAYFNSILQPVIDANGAVEGIAIVSAEVTPQVRARLEADEMRKSAEEANRAKTQFLTAMSHELRTPLNAIAGYAELINMGIRGPTTEAQQTDLGRILRSQRHLLGVITDILNFARLDAGRVEYDLKPVEVGTVIGEIEGLVSPQLAAKQLSFRHDAGAQDLKATADADKLRQILLNLLGNSIKFTEPGGQVDIVCSGDEQRVRIAVRDTGIGIPADRLSSIFEPFVQVNRKLAHPAEGTGLGLAISRELARGMNGDLTVESELGVGSTFTVLLPRA